MKKVNVLPSSPVSSKQSNFNMLKRKRIMYAVICVASPELPSPICTNVQGFSVLFLFFCSFCWLMSVYVADIDRAELGDITSFFNQVMSQ
jgi:hypothetical protein